MVYAGSSPAAGTKHLGVYEAMSDNEQLKDMYVFETALHLSATSNSMMRQLWPMNGDKMLALNPLERANLAYAVAEFLNEQIEKYAGAWERLAKE